MGQSPSGPFAPVAGGERAMEIRVRGRVQGVGFRPTVWRHAREVGVRGEVLNDGDGVLIRAAGSEAALAAFLDRIGTAPPPLSAIASVETAPFSGPLPEDFRIAPTVAGAAHTEVTPDASICPACTEEVLDPARRRYLYPFTNCTHCGPRLSIVDASP